MAAVARMERAGVPTDTETYDAIIANWDRLKTHLIDDVNGNFDVYEDTTFKSAKFEQYLSAHGIPWPRLPSGALCLDEDSFREQTRRWPF